jgi:hypothetical protein
MYIVSTKDLRKGMLISAVYVEKPWQLFWQFSIDSPMEVTGVSDGRYVSLQNAVKKKVWDGLSKEEQELWTGLSPMSDLIDARNMAFLLVNNNANGSQIKY